MRLLRCNGSQTKILFLRGIIYYGGVHFTSRIMGLDGRIWYHDGIETGRAHIDEHYLDSHAADFLDFCRGGFPVTLVYADASG
ncbi:hypothetical protein DFH09DRAFT_941468 [Mycena vulgaris]|nr:hypothetical protein DFH09DRAFT_941468 [Mycena vulgaris]